MSNPSRAALGPLDALDRLIAAASDLPKVRVQGVVTEVAPAYCRISGLSPFVKLGESAANFLTNSAFDPSSRIPEYKVCAVRVERA